RQPAEPKASESDEVVGPATPAVTAEQVREECTDEEIPLIHGKAELDLHDTKQRIALLERVMKLPYIKATRYASVGEERFVCRDDVVTVFHEHAKAIRALRNPAKPA